MALPVFGSQIRAVKTGRTYLHEEAARVNASRCNRLYEAHEFTIPSPTTNVSIKTVVNHATSCTCGRAAGPFAIIQRADRVSIRNVGTGTVSIRYVDPTGDPFSLDPGEDHDFDVVETDDVFLSNASGVAVPLRVVLA